MQRVDKQESRPQIAGAPARKFGKVMQVAMAPGVTGAQRVQLNGKAPGALAWPGGGSGVALQLRAAWRRVYRRYGAVHPGGLTEHSDNGLQGVRRDAHISAAPVTVGRLHAMSAREPLQFLPSHHCSVPVFAATLVPPVHVPRSRARRPTTNRRLSLEWCR